jgi:hypothetical protein
MDKKYKEHQKGAILSEAEGRLGQYQQHAQFQIEKEALQEVMEQAKRAVDEAERHFRQCRKNLDDHLRRTHGGVIEERREFFMACPSNDCRGKLSTSYKCGMCEHFFCPDCHKDKGVDRNAANHECEQDDINTIKMLRDNTRPCPKCHMGIYKTEGCDQMWCVQCHNPHFYEHQRAVNGGVAPRVPGDVPCGGMPTFYEMKRRRVTDDVNCRWLINLHRTINELTDLEMPRIYRKFNDYEAYQREYSVRYLRNKITREKLVDELYKKTRQAEKYRRYYDVIQTLTTSVAECLRNYIIGEDQAVVRRSCEELIKQAHEEEDRMKKQYNMTLPKVEVKMVIN